MEPRQPGYLSYLLRLFWQPGKGGASTRRIQLRSTRNNEAWIFQSLREMNAFLEAEITGEEDKANAKKEPME